MKFSDETLMAYADGELDLVSRAEIESAMAIDPEIRRVVERHRALRSRVQSAYGSVLQEPIPMKLSSLITPQVATPVIDLAAQRAARADARPAAAPKRWALPRWSAMAAAIALAFFVEKGFEIAAFVPARLEVDDPARARPVDERAVDDDVLQLPIGETGEGELAFRFAMCG